MRDITADLIERLNELHAERERIKVRLAEIDKDEEVVGAMLSRENAVTSRLQLDIFASPASDRPGGGKYSTPLASAVLEFLRGRGPTPLQDIKQYAMLRGIDFGEKSPGRSIHILLLGMEQNNVVERDESGSWKLKS